MKFTGHVQDIFFLNSSFILNSIEEFDFKIKISLYIFQYNIIYYVSKFKKNI